MTAGTLTERQGIAHARATVKRSGTSFAAGMSILPKPRRDAMHAVYAFCREVDDIADGDAPAAEKLKELSALRQEIERVYENVATTPTGAALSGPVKAFDLPKQEFLLLIEGMEMDADGPVIAPSLETLFAYTRRVAGAVGMLSMPIFGAPRSEAAERFALSLGDALQLTNILRDVEEDAEFGRMYLPRELLERHAAPMRPHFVVESPQTPYVKADLAEIARARFADARAALRELDWKILRPALMMMGIYEAYLDRMDFARVRQRKLAGLQKLFIAARWYFAPKLG